MIQPTGSRSVAIDLLRRMYAASPTWQERVKEFTQEEAARRIWVPWFNYDESLRPMIAIREGEPSVQWSRNSGGSRNTLLPIGELEVHVLDRILNYENLAEDAVLFRNLCDGLIDDVAQLAGVDGWLNITEINETQPPAFNPPETQTSGGTEGYHIAVHTVTWGQI